MLADECHRRPKVLLWEIYTKGRGRARCGRIWRLRMSIFFPWLNETFLSTHKYSLENPTSRLGNFCAPDFFFFPFFVFSTLVEFPSIFIWENFNFILWLFAACSYVDSLVIYLGGIVTSGGSHLQSHYRIRVTHENAVRRISSLPRSVLAGFISSFMAPDGPPLAQRDWRDWEI